jgi:hypothetical protein
MEGEKAQRVRQDAGALMLVLCMTLAASVLSASFVVFLVRWVGVGGLSWARNGDGSNAWLCLGMCCCGMQYWLEAAGLACSVWYIRVCTGVSATQHAALCCVDCICCREADNNSKHLQLVSGAHPTAYWLANFSWDLINYCLPAAGIELLVAWYRQPQLSGIRLVAMALLLLAFGGAGINLTYLCHFMFAVSCSYVVYE